MNGRLLDNHYLIEMDIKEMIDGIELGAAAYYMESAFKAGIDLTI